SDSLTGDPGTRVHVTFERPGVATPIDANFTRAIIHIPAVPYTLTLGNKIGYMPLQVFNDNAADNVAAAVKQFEKNGDPGGILDQSFEIANMFLRPGQEILDVKYRDTTQNFVARATPIAPNIPIIV